MLSHRPPVLLAALVALAAILAGCHSTPAPPPGHIVHAAAPAPPGGLTIPSIFVDPQSTAVDGRGVPCASDLNTGTQATCGGVGTGPLKSWAGVTQLWGCANVASCVPRLRQNTTITFLSSHTDNTDPVYFTPVLEQGAWAAITGATTLVATVSLSSVTAKNRTTPQLLQANIGGTGVDGGAFAGGAAFLLVNTTHPSHAFSFAQVSGSTYSISQPLVAVAPGGFGGTATEVDTWANNDVVQVYSYPNVNLVRLAPMVTDYGGSPFTNALYIQSLNAWDPVFSVDNLYVGRQVFFTDVFTSRLIALDSASYDGPSPRAPGTAGWGMLNVYEGAGLMGGNSSSTSALFSFFGGIAGGAIIASNAYLDYDTIWNSNAAGANVAQTGFVDVQSGKTIVFQSTSGIAGANSGNFWGAGTVNVAGDCRLSYPAGSGKGASTFVGVTLQANGQTKSCIENPAAASSFGTCNITLSGANLDSNLGTTTGCLVGPGAAYCNAP